MSTPETKLRIFMRPSGNEIVFSNNSATFVRESLVPISEGTQIVRDVNGNLRSLGNTAFRKYRLSLSCNDNRLPPLSNLWASQVVDVEMSTVIAERGTTPSRTAVAGTVSVIGSRVEYRPRLTMMITRPPELSDVEWQGGAAGWSMELEEVLGSTDVPVSTDRLILGPRPVREASRGTFLSVGYASELTRIPDTQAVTWSIVVGSLPPGLSLNPATGVVSGTPTEGGVYAFSLRAQGAADVEAVQTYVFDVEAPASSVIWAKGSGGSAVNFVDLDGSSKTAFVFNATASFNCTTAGWVLLRIFSGAGGLGTAGSGSGGGAGGYREVMVWVEPGLHPIEGGAAGAPGSLGSISDANRHGYPGTPSSAFGVSPRGGGGGVGATSNTSNISRTIGGSGGGGARQNGSSNATHPGAVGMPYLGHNGSDAPVVGTEHSGGAGGGAKGPGNGINGGPGIRYWIGQWRDVCGGGAGSIGSTGSTVGTASHGATPGQSGAPNSGAGASAGTWGNQGGSGRVEIIVGV